MHYPEIKIVLIQRGLSQVQVARRLGRDPAWLSRVIHGWVVPSEAEKRAISKILQRDVRELFPDEAGK